MMKLNTNSNLTVNGVVPGNPFDNVYPTLVECFAIILFGYLAGRSKLVSPTQAKGLEIYAVSAALPASILKSIIELNFAKVNWGLWLSLLVSKLALFLIVVTVSLILTRPVNFGKAGIYGTFVTQSNDFALGLPLFSALYRNSPYNFCQYIYLLIPVTFGLLNPIAFFLLEYEKSKSTDGPAVSKLMIAWRVFKKVCTNPLVYTVIIGLIINFISKHHLPEVINRCLEVLASSYSAVALFCLGLTMVGSMGQFTASWFIISVVLIMAKSILLPFMCKETVHFISSYTSSLNKSDIASMSRFGFLYGTLPTAPTVAIYAAKYAVGTDTIGATMVLGTVMSAPIMFISSKMILIEMMTEEKEFSTMISRAIFDVSILGVACCLWVFMVFIVCKQMFRSPQRWTTCLVVSQLLVSICPIFNAFSQNSSGVQMFARWLFLSSYLSVVVWTALLALLLAYIRLKGESSQKRWMTIAKPVIGWGVPSVLALILVLSLRHEPSMKVDNNDFINALRERVLNIVIAICLIISVAVTVISLIVLHRRDRYCKCEHRKQSEGEDGSSESDDITREVCSACRSTNGSYRILTRNGHNASSLRSGGNSSSRDSVEESALVETSSMTDAEDMSFLIIEHHDKAEIVSSMKVANLSDFEDNLIKMRQFSDGGKHQLNRHIILLILLSMSNLLGIFLCFWFLFGNTIDGIYLEIKFLVSVLTFGQGFISFASFGFNKELFITPTMKRLLQFHFSCMNRRITLPPYGSLSAADLRTCEQFRAHHLQRCKEELVKNLRFHLKSYNNVFRGDEFVSWLLEYGLVEDRHAGVCYGNNLLNGRVLKHCVEEHHFQDLPYFYTFIEGEVP